MNDPFPFPETLALFLTLPVDVRARLSRVPGPAWYVSKRARDRFPHATLFAEPREDANHLASGWLPTNVQAIYREAHELAFARLPVEEPYLEVDEWGSRIWGYDEFDDEVGVRESREVGTTDRERANEDFDVALRVLREIATYPARTR